MKLRLAGGDREKREAQVEEPFVPQRPRHVRQHRRCIVIAVDIAQIKKTQRKPAAEFPRKLKKRNVDLEILTREYDRQRAYGHEQIEGPDAKDPSHVKL